MRVLITGGAGFVGSNAAVALATRHPDWSVVALDNLKRRGSELNLPRLKEAGVEFVHGDVRAHDDLMQLEPVQAIVECSAEPSVLAGAGAPRYAVESNLVGAFNCLELARRDGAQFVFLSTSRVYPVGALNRVRYSEGPTRFELSGEQELPGVSPAGISESFPLAGARTVYGATKLAAELLVEEYRESFGVRAVVDRFGVIAGPWQMGKVDQGVFTFWMAAHYFRRPLSYIGYGGAGKQVRDVVHVDDLVELIDDQLARPDDWDGVVVNAGGGREGSLSLREATELCQEITGNRVDVEPVLENRPGDVPIYISDCSQLWRETAWRPARTPRAIMEDVFGWLQDDEGALGRMLA